MQTKTWMDRAQQYLQNILTDHSQKRHGSLCINMNTWHKNINRAMTSNISKSLKSATTSKLLCMLVLVTTEITKIHGIHPCKDDMTYFKTHVGLKFRGGTHQSWQNDKCPITDMDLERTETSTSPTTCRASR